MAQKDNGNRVPFGLCKKFGIEISKDWTPRDAWEALKRGGYISSISEAYEQYYREINDKSTEQLAKEQRREIKGDRVTEIDSATGKPKFGGAKTPEFVDALTDAKATVAKERPQESWRVSSPSAEEFEQEHPGAVMHVTQGGSTVAVTPDGDIVGLCKKPSDNVKGKDLLKIAVENGGKKLDSFSGLWKFYSQNGFEPVSWTPFDKEYAPTDWNEEYEEEPVIFWKYTGKMTAYSTEEDFFNAVKASSSYDEAQKARDEEIKREVNHD